MPETRGKTLAESASTWLQVVFAGLGVTIALVAAVIAYFAWVQPHSPDGDEVAAPPDPAATATGPGRTTPLPTTVAPTAAGVALGELPPTVGATYIRRSGADLVMPCATGQTGDRQRIVEYDVLGRYTALDAELRVSKARDRDTPLQIKIFADGPEVANQIVTKGVTTRLSVVLDGRQTMRVQLTCQSPDGEITLGNPRLIRA
jgi:hypothetical protein